MPTTSPVAEARPAAGSGAGARARSIARRRSCSSVTRSSVWACITGSNRTVERTGSIFARWSAISACLSRSNGVGQLAGRRSRCRGSRRPRPRSPSRSNGAPSARSIRGRDPLRLADAAHRPEQDPELVRAEPGDRVGGPRRARRAAGRPRASSRSPAAWPRLSLTTLNRSRSSRISATRVAAARRRPSIRPASSSCSARRLRSSVRFGRLVSVSWSGEVGPAADLGLRPLQQPRVVERHRRQLAEPGQRLDLALGERPRDVARRQADQRRAPRRPR